MATIRVKLVGDSSSLERSFKRAGSGARKFNRDIGTVDKVSKRTRGAFSGIARGAGIATGAIGVAGLAGAARSAFLEMSESAKVTAQTNAVIKSTGGAANVSAKQVERLGDAVLAKSGIDDEAVRSGANMLLTFRNIRNETGRGNDIFNQTTKVLADMDTALTSGSSTQESLRASAIRLGKAMNDPVKGITSLRRVGIQFTEDETKKIKALAESGDMMGAQRLILKELNTEFGGSAAALGTTLPGKIAIARESFRNLGGSLAVTLVPALTSAVNSLNRFLSNTKNQKTILEGFRTVVAAVSAAVRVLSGTFRVLSRVVGGSRNAILLIIGSFIAFKAVKMTAAVLDIARSFGIMTARTNAATLATRRATLASRGFRASLIGKAGLVAAAGVAAFALTTLLLKVTGLDKKLKSVGASAFDAAAKLGLVNDPGAQFEGKRVLTGLESKRVRDTAARLQAQGLTSEQAAARIARARPNVARRDIEVLAGVYGARPPAPVVVNTKVQLNRETVGKVVTETQRRTAKRTGAPRRGRVGGR